jgi:drug/metabolite transporter (DMT)-like permease
MIPLDQVEFEKHAGTALADDHLHARRRFNLSPQVFDALLLLLPAMLVTATAQLSFKHGMNQVGELQWSVNALSTILPKMLMNPFIWIGVVGEFGALGLYLSVISRVPLSLAYPVLALGYLITAIEARIFLGEQVTLLRVVGIGVIIVGVALVGLSEGGQK